MTGIDLGKYPYEELEGIKKAILAKFPSIIDLSIGTPVDPVPHIVADSVYSAPFDYSGYPQSAGSTELLYAAKSWLERKFGLKISNDQLAACVGTKEFISSVVGFLKSLSPDKKYVLYPVPSYPTYRVSAILAGLNPVGVPVIKGTLQLDELPAEIRQKTLCVFVNSPSNPSGELGNLKEVLDWAKNNDVIVLSDECYIDFVWEKKSVSALQFGSDNLISLFSLSKRSNMAGLRVGFYAGDGSIVQHLKELRKHAGLMIPGPCQTAGIAALSDESHVETQRFRYKKRLKTMVQFLNKLGLKCSMPEATFYIWLNVKEFCQENLGVSRGYDWAFTQHFAERFGALVSPGSFYEVNSEHVRIAMVVRDNQLAELVDRV
jgi:aspartate/methionine/tyrosine aminotransferase